MSAAWSGDTCPWSNATPNKRLATLRMPHRGIRLIMLDIRGSLLLVI
jgi:hypothetical protein